jgi:hypothetical protein
LSRSAPTKRYTGPLRLNSAAINDNIARARLNYKFGN